MTSETPQPIRLADYKQTPYLIDTVHLDFNLGHDATDVTARLSLRPNPASSERNAPLVLDGERLTLLSLSLSGEELPPGAYVLTEQTLTIAQVPQQPFSLEIVTRCNPAANTELSGLYVSNGVFCTQCEAEGFRRITYFYDRPDVMARYRVRIEAERDTVPVLLSNGNPVEDGLIGGTSRHYAVWDDPFPKPSYLFALVAGDLGAVHDTFTTMNGRTVELGIYVIKGNEDRCAWAMEAVKASMRWDE